MKFVQVAALTLLLISLGPRIANCQTKDISPQPSQNKVLNPGADAKPNDQLQKGPESAVAFSQAVSQWEVLIIGGSIAVLLGSSYLRPRSPRGRSWYLLFVPAWGFLFYSLYMGMSAQQNVLALSNLKNVDVGPTKEELARHIARQISTFEIGLAILGVWLVIYLAWWIWSAPAPKAE